MKRLQRTRPDLRIVVMSATLDAAPVGPISGRLSNIEVEGRLFELTVKHLPHSPALLHVQVKSALELLLTDDTLAHTLVFLPAAAEVRRTMRECESVAYRAGLLVLPLHGDLPRKSRIVQSRPIRNQNLSLPRMSRRVQ